MVSDVVGKLAPDDNAINDVLARLSNPEYPTMSAGQSADNTHNREFFVTMYPHLDRNVVIAEVEKLQGEETTVIMKKLDILSRVEDPDVLRGCAYWMAQNHEMPQFSIFKIPRDGNCAFHALVKWYSLLFEGKISVTQLKDQIITEIEGGSRVSFIQEMRFDNEYDNIHDNNEMLASYAKKLRENQMWGGTPEFKLVANMWGVRIQVWTSFDNYVHNLKDKLPNSVSLYQASLGVDYVCYPDNCFGSDATRTVHLLYSGSSHYDCLLPQ